MLMNIYYAFVRRELLDSLRFNDQWKKYDEL